MKYALRPRVRVRVPPGAPSTFASITPVNVAAWALGGLFMTDPLLPSAAQGFCIAQLELGTLFRRAGLML
jgi:hypothetical protein